MTSEFSKRTLTLTVVCLLPILAGLIYLLTTYKTIDAQIKTITLSVNGLSTNYTTTAKTVGEFVIQNYPDKINIVSIFPNESQLLASGDMIFLQLKPTAVNRAVASNLKSAIEKGSEPQPKSPVYQGLATWYTFGEGMGAASTQFPKGTRLRVVAVNSNKTIDVIINDYGPAKWTGIALDLNKPAFLKLAPLGAGKISIKYFVI
jgi:rare lipoprotein A (peptidoglycan hydrolase)